MYEIGICQSLSNGSSNCWSTLYVLWSSVLLLEKSTIIDVEPLTDMCWEEYLGWNKLYGGEWSASSWYIQSSPAIWDPEACQSQPGYQGNVAAGDLMMGLVQGLAGSMGNWDLRLTVTKKWVMLTECISKTTYVSEESYNQCCPNWETSGSKMIMTLMTRFHITSCLWMFITEVMLWELCFNLTFLCIYIVVQMRECYHSLMRACHPAKERIAVMR